LFSFFHNLALFCINENKQLKTEYDEKLKMASAIIPELFCLDDSYQRRKSLRWSDQLRAGVA
jgi:hypothetical protein